MSSFDNRLVRSCNTTSFSTW